MSDSTLPVRLRPVTVKCSRVDFELSRGARDKLVRRLRHLDGATRVLAKFDRASDVELTANEKGFLVVAITAWMEDAGRSRVPGEVIRLHTTLLGDLYYPVEEPEAQVRPSEPAVDAAPAAPEPAAERVPDPRLVAVQRELELHLHELAELDDGSLGRARAALRRAAAELASALRS